MVLAFFASSDGIVMENLAHRFCREVQVRREGGEGGNRGCESCVAFRSFSLILASDTTFYHPFSHAHLPPSLPPSLHPSFCV